MRTIVLSEKSHTTLTTGAPDSSCEHATRMFSNKDLFTLFLPLLLEQFLTFLVGLADSIMVASVGEAAVSAVSLVEFIMALLISLFASLATGGAIIAGQYMGQNQMRNAQEAANQLVWLVGFVSMGIMILVSVTRPFILQMLFGQVSTEVWNYANTYLAIVAFSIPAVGLYSAGSAVFRTMGNSRLPMQIALFMGSMTVIGNALVLYVFDLSVTGVAMSALAARTSGAVLIIAFALNSNLALHLRKSTKYIFRWSMIKRIMSICVPYGLESWFSVWLPPSAQPP